MNVSSPVQPDDPINIAWEAWKKTHDFVNSRRWAAHDEHLDGSLWNAFANGYRAGEKDDPCCHCGMLLSQHSHLSNHDFRELPEAEAESVKTVILGFASWKDGSFELIVRDNETLDETTLKGTLEPGQFEKIGLILPTCVFVDAVLPPPVRGEKWTVEDRDAGLVSLRVSESKSYLFDRRYKGFLESIASDHATLALPIEANPYFMSDESDQDGDPDYDDIRAVVLQMRSLRSQVGELMKIKACDNRLSVEEIVNQATNEVCFLADNGKVRNIIRRACLQAMNIADKKASRCPPTHGIPIPVL